VDLVVTDTVMPRVGGVELANRLWSERGHVPVIFTSGYAEDGQLSDVLQRPGTRFVAKPFVPGDLVRLVRDTLDARDE